MEIHNTGERTKRYKEPSQHPAERGSRNRRDSPPPPQKGDEEDEERKGIRRQTILPPLPGHGQVRVGNWGYFGARRNRPSQQDLSWETLL